MGIDGSGGGGGVHVVGCCGTVTSTAQDERDQRVRGVLPSALNDHRAFRLQTRILSPASKCSSFIDPPVDDDALLMCECRKVQAGRRGGPSD